MKAYKRNKCADACKAASFSLFGFAALMCAFPGHAFAQEEAAGIEAILPDMAEFVPMLVAFIILCAILAKFGWPKFAEMLAKREESIRDSLQKADEARVESERVLAQYQAQLEEAKTQAHSIVSDAKAAAEALQADMSRKAAAEAERMIEKAKLAIEAEKKAAVAELQSSLADMTIDVASKVIAKDLSDAEHRAIIERYVQEAGSFNGR